MFQESEVESCEQQDDPYIRCQPFPEPVLEEQDIQSDYDNGQQHYVKRDSCRSFHSGHQFKYSGCHGFEYSF